MTNISTQSIRLAVLNGEAGKIRELLLNQGQVSQVLEIYDFNLFTSEKLAKAWGITIPNASMKLKRFYLVGYLERTKTTAPSGGIEYIYSLPLWHE